MGKKESSTFNGSLSSCYQRLPYGSLASIRQSSELCTCVCCRINFALAGKQSGMSQSGLVSRDGCELGLYHSEAISLWLHLSEQILHCKIGIINTLILRAASRIKWHSGKGNVLSIGTNGVHFKENRCSVRWRWRTRGAGEGKGGE